MLFGNILNYNFFVNDYFILCYFSSLKYYHLNLSLELPEIL